MANEISLWPHFIDPWFYPILRRAASHTDNMDSAAFLSSSDMHCVWASNCLTAIYEDLIHADPRADHADVVELMHKTRLQLEVVHTLLRRCDPRTTMNVNLWQMASNVMEMLVEDFAFVRDLWFSPVMDLLDPYLPAEYGIRREIAMNNVNVVEKKEEEEEEGSTDAELSAVYPVEAGAFAVEDNRSMGLSSSFVEEMEQHCQRMDECERAQKEKFVKQLQELYAATQMECLSREMYRLRSVHLLNFVDLHHSFLCRHIHELEESTQYILVRIQEELSSENQFAPQEMTHLKRKVHDLLHDCVVFVKLKSHV
jgi:hypothetical protein